MTLAQLDALNEVDSKTNSQAGGDGAALPAPDKRTWGTAHDFAQWERRANG